MLPCCKFKQSPDVLNITKHSIEDYRNSPMLESVKTDFVNGQWPAGCERCQIEESVGVKSKRQLDYDRFKHEYDSYDFNNNQLLTASIAIGNVCNLKCIMCNPYASSKWQKEYNDIYNVKIPSIERVRQDLIDTLVEIAPGLIHIDIHGGEPFLSNIDQHHALLDHYIQSGQAHNISIHYTTNGSTWPSQECLEKWPNFKEIDLQLSIDGVGKRYEYIRYPADWATLQNNVKRFLEYQTKNINFKISVSCTVSAYNILYLDELIGWCQSVGLPTPWMGKLHNPEPLRPTVWADPARTYIIDSLNKSQYNEVIKWANLLESTDDSALFNEFKTRTQVHDQYRGLCFTSVFPELATYI